MRLEENFGEDESGGERAQRHWLYNHDTVCWHHKGRRSAEGNRLTVDSPTRMNDAWRGTLEWSRRSGVSHVWLPQGAVGFVSMKGFIMPISEWRKKMKTEYPSLGSTPARKGHLDKVVNPSVLFNNVGDYVEAHCD